MTELYFAYGSNLSRARLLDRVPGAESLGAARLDGHGLRMNKRGRDGTAKANLVVSTREHVWGALYRFAADEWPGLDRVELGYERFDVRVENPAGTGVSAQTYRSDRLVRDTAPAPWYVELMCAGALEHELPDEWLDRLAALARGL